MDKLRSHLRYFLRWLDTLLVSRKYCVLCQREPATTYLVTTWGKQVGVCQQCYDEVMGV